MSTTAVHPVDERLPTGKLTALGLQHVLVMYAGAVAVPLIVGRALKLGPQEVAFLISADLFCCGIATLIQALGATQWFGIRLPVMMGVTFAAVGPMVAIANGNPGTDGARMLFGAIIGAGVISILIAPVVSRMLRFFPPVVTGTIIAVIGINLMRVGINWIFGNPVGPTAPLTFSPEHTEWLSTMRSAGATGQPGVLPVPQGLTLAPTVPNPNYAKLSGVAVSAIVLASILLIAKFAMGFIANISVLLGIVIGGIVATATGMMNFDKVGKAAWIDVVTPFHFGTPIFDPVMILTMTLIMIVILLALGLLPKMAALVESLPTVVLGGAGIVMFGMVAATGIRILGGVDYTHNRNNALIVAISIGVGMIPLVAPRYLQWMPHAIHPLIESGIVLASIAAVLLNLFFNGARADTEASIRAARQAEAH